MQVGEFEKGANVGLNFTHKTSSFHGAHLFSRKLKQRRINLLRLRLPWRMLFNRHPSSCQSPRSMEFTHLIVSACSTLCHWPLWSRTLHGDSTLKLTRLSPTLCHFFHRAAYNNTSSPHITYLRVQGQVVAGSYSSYRSCNGTHFRPLLQRRFEIRSNPIATYIKVPAF